MIKIVVFDFDDTLVRSEKIKKESYSLVFSDIPEATMIVQEFVASHDRTGRSEAIRGILDKLRDKKVINDSSNKQAKKYLKKYNKLVDQAIIKAQDIEGAIEILKYLSKRYYLYINTATPHDSIVKIIKGKNWTNFFKGVYGSPPGTKSEHLWEIIAKEKVLSEQVVVVGDGQGDLHSATIAKTHFIGFRGEFGSWQDKENFIILDKLQKLEKLISQL